MTPSPRQSRAGIRSSEVKLENEEEVLDPIAPRHFSDPSPPGSPSQAQASANTTLDDRPKPPLSPTLLFATFAVGALGCAPFGVDLSDTPAPPPPEDGGSVRADASVPVDAAPPFKGCASSPAAIFCDDFEDRTSASAVVGSRPWTITSGVGAQAISLDDGYQSAKALSLTYPDGTVRLAAGLQIELQTSGTKVHLETTVRVAGSFRYLQVLSCLIGASFFNIAIDNGRWVLQYPGAPDYLPTTVKVSPGIWSTIALEIEVAPAPVVRMLVNESLLRERVPEVSQPAVGRFVLSMRPNFGEVATSDDVRVDYDNVVATP